MVIGRSKKQANFDRALCAVKSQLGEEVLFRTIRQKVINHFQALINKQIQIQPPGPMPETRLAPLRGRKILIFSDSRQTAARLAPNLQKYSTQDALRPLICSGFKTLQGFDTLKKRLSLEGFIPLCIIERQDYGSPLATRTAGRGKFQ